VRSNAEARWEKALREAAAPRDALQGKARTLSEQ
jgi:hypothetical protein